MFSLLVLMKQKKCSTGLPQQRSLKPPRSSLWDLGDQVLPDAAGALLWPHLCQSWHTLQICQGCCQRTFSMSLVKTSTTLLSHLVSTHGLSPKPDWKLHLLLRRSSRSPCRTGGEYPTLTDFWVRGRSLQTCLRIGWKEIIRAYW